MKNKNDNSSIIHKKNFKKLPEAEILYLINIKKDEKAKEELIRRIYRRLNKK
jgi:hypothetical protein